MTAGRWSVLFWGGLLFRLGMDAFYCLLACTSTPSCAAPVVQFIGKAFLTNRPGWPVLGPSFVGKRQGLYFRVHWVPVRSTAPGRILPLAPPFRSRWRSIAPAKLRSRHASFHRWLTGWGPGQGVRHRDGRCMRLLWWGRRPSEALHSPLTGRSTGIQVASFQRSDKALTFDVRTRIPGTGYSTRWLDRESSSLCSIAAAASGNSRR